MGHAFYNPYTDSWLEKEYGELQKATNDFLEMEIRDKRRKAKFARSKKAGSVFLEKYFEGTELCKLLDFLDKYIESPYRNSMWLIGEAIAYSQLGNKKSNKFDKSLQSAYELIKKGKVSSLAKVNKQIRKIYSDAPINRNGTASSVGVLYNTKNLISSFLEISENIGNPEVHDKKISGIIKEIDWINNFETNGVNLYKSVLHGVLSITGLGIGGLSGYIYPEIYHTLHLAREYASKNTFESEKIANCFYSRSIEILQQRITGVYKEEFGEKGKEQLASLISLLRNAREVSS